MDNKKVNLNNKINVVESLKTTGKRLEDVGKKPYLQDGPYIKSKPYIKFYPYKEIIIPIPRPYKKINPVAKAELKQSTSYIEFEGVLEKETTLKLAELGCKLTEKENTRRFWPVLRRIGNPSVEDFRLADIGRQFWHGGCWKSRREGPQNSLI